ncbi:MAG: EamA family transporter [Planctomycetales bacterium]|nr:EamA family transporter [Planctomycetales bacterium]
MPYLFFLFICLVWGGSFILMDRATHALGPVTIAICRLLGGALVLAIYWLFNPQRIKLNPAYWANVAVVAALANALPFVIQPYVMVQAGEHAYFGMMVALVPLATILASIPTLGIWPSRRQLVGVLGGIVCLTAAVYDGSARGISPGLLALAITVPLSYAIGNTYIKWRLDHMPPLVLTISFLAVGGLLLLPLQFSPSTLAAMQLDGPAQPYDWPLAIASVAFLSIVGTGIAILMFIHLVKHQGPLFAGMVTYVVPVLALIWGQYDKERLTAAQLFAIAGVLTMVAFVQWGAAAPARQTLEPLPD